MADGRLYRTSPLDFIPDRSRQLFELFILFIDRCLSNVIMAAIAAKILSVRIANPVFQEFHKSSHTTGYYQKSQLTGTYH